MKGKDYDNRIQHSKYGFYHRARGSAYLKNRLPCHKAIAKFSEFKFFFFSDFFLTSTCCCRDYPMKHKGNMYLTVL